MTSLTVLLTGYAVGLVAGVVAWMVRKGVNNS
jgi:hypothetical protein